MASKRKLVEAVAYMRTSSAANVGGDKDSEQRQRAAIEGYAKHAGIVIVDWFYDAAVKGADPVTIPALLPCSTASPATVCGPSSWKVLTALPAISQCSSPDTIS